MGLAFILQVHARFRQAHFIFGQVNYTWYLPDRQVDLEKKILSLVDHPCIIPYRRGLLLQPGYVSDGKSYHLHAWGLSCSTTKQQDFQRRSLGSQQHLEDPQQTECTTIGGFASLTLVTGQGIDPLGPTSAQIAVFLYYLFDTHSLWNYRGLELHWPCHNRTWALC